MSWFNWIGLLIILIIMIPNVIYARKNKEGFVNLWHNKAVELLEQIGRFGCFIFMIFNIPYTWFGFWFNSALIFYIIENIVLVVAYCIIWAVCFKQNSIFRCLTLSILPSICFLFSGIMLASMPLIISAVIFAPCHITISYKNTLAELELKKSKISLT